MVQPIKTRVFTAGESLADFILEYIPSLEEGDVIVVTSKIVSYAEHRLVELKSEEDRERYIKEESDIMVRTPYTWITLRDGMALSSAGVDESNANGKLLLLPKDPYASAQALWSDLKKRSNIANLGLIFTDSRTIPLRRGSIGVAIAHAGFHAVKSYVGKPDLFGRELHVSRANTADALAAAAVHTMGESNESTPLALIRGAAIDFTQERIGPEDIQVDIHDDVYGPLFQAVLGSNQQKMNPKYQGEVEYKDKK